MTTVYLAPIYNGQQFFDSQGRVLNGGKINTYTAGTTTPAATYTTQAGSVQNANPIVLNSSGRTPNQIWLVSGSSYKFVLTDSSNNVLETQDNLVGLNDQPILATAEWLSVSSAPTYSAVNKFTNTVDTTGTYVLGRRIRAHVTAGALVYGTVVSSVYAASVTTVTLLMDSTNLDAGLTAVDVGILNSVNKSTPLLAFTAHKTVDQTVFALIKFETVDFQVGTGYDPSTGVFTAPINGWYSFSAGLQIANTSGASITNGIGIAITSGGTLNAAAQTVPIPNGSTLDFSASVNAIRLNAGDTVDVEVGSIGVSNVAKASWFSRFSGFLL